MTENKRIILNIVVTYGRSLYALVIGLFCGRWALMALGEVDYGLMGVIGGLTAFVSFFNGVLAAGVGRFYAISVGEKQIDYEKGIELCRSWFTTAVLVHAIVPVFLVVIGYPIGVWAIRNFLTIPIERVQTCVWVWRCVCVTSFVGMISVPFTAMYTAKQEIAELTIYSFCTTTLNVLVLYYMINHKGDWLGVYAAWTCILALVPNVFICVRAGMKYEECRIRAAYLRCWGRVMSILRYSGWLIMGNLADMLGIQGMSVLVNKYCGPRVNAAQAIGNNVSSQCTTLSGSMIGAFWPVILSAYGAGRLDDVRTYVYRVCRIGTAMILLFAIPLALEVDEVLLLWLKNPPRYASGLCLCALAVAAIDKTSYGYAIAVHATGKMAKYILVISSGLLLAIPLAWMFLNGGCSVYFAAGAVVATRAWSAIARVFMARSLIGVSLGYWLWKIVVPLSLASMLSLAAGLFLQLFMSPSLMRVLMTAIVCNLVLVPMIYCHVFDAGERKFLQAKLRNRFSVLLTKLGYYNGGKN